MLLFHMSFQATYFLSHKVTKNVTEKSHGRFRKFVYLTVSSVSLICKKGNKNRRIKNKSEILLFGLILFNVC